MPTTKARRRRQLSALPRRRARSRRTASHAPPAKPARARKVEPEARRQAILDAALHRVRRARLRGGAARRRGGARRRRQGHALSLFPRQGGAVRGAGPQRGVAHHRARAQGGGRARHPGPCHLSRRSLPCSRRRCWAPSASCCCGSSLPRARAFRRVAEFYHREVVTRGLGLMRAVAERAARAGRVRHRRGRALSPAHRRAADPGGDLGRPVRHASIPSTSPVSCARTARC